MFTGSTEVARIIQRTLASRAMRRAPDPADRRNRRAERDDRGLLGAGRAGRGRRHRLGVRQRRAALSALRVLCLQDDVADRTLTMLRGAMAELALGNPDELATDIGPVITAQARRDRGTRGGDGTARGDRAPPAPARHLRPWHVRGADADRDPGIEALGREVFGPVLHVVRLPRAT
jgi:RHH-type proline utilization regulon transcriptional repressor/proline dehydrogenase/delta 1-pyrroline-5-carboxylate dehydrogenase